jgi:hypothetical protein
MVVLFSCFPIYVLVEDADDDVTFTLQWLHWCLLLECVHCEVVVLIITKDSQVKCCSLVIIVVTISNSSGEQQW